MTCDNFSTVDCVRHQWTALPPLKLRGVGTGLVESLPSYVARLLVATGVPQKHLSSRLGLRGQSTPHTLGSILAAKYPQSTQAAIDELERLTGAVNLRCGTVWALSLILGEKSRCNHTHAWRRWCPICYIEWNTDSYEPLAWGIDVLSNCPLHGCRLEQWCHVCGSAQRHALNLDQRLVCWKCKAKLGGRIRQGTEHSFLQWVDQQVLHLVAYCANEHPEPLPFRVLFEFLRGLHQNIRGRSARSLGNQIAQYERLARTQGQRVSLRSLINLCAIQGVDVIEFLGAPREASSPRLFDEWSGLRYLPLPHPNRAQRIYVARKCLLDFLARRPTYVPPIDLLLGGFRVQLLAIRDVAVHAYDFYEDRYSIQGSSLTKSLFRAAYLSAMSFVSELPLDTTGDLRRIFAKVAARAEVPALMAKRATQSALVALATQSKEKIEAYEREMPVDEALEWFVQNRQCVWREGDL
jgi:TniQ